MLISGPAGEVRAGHQGDAGLRVPGAQASSRDKVAAAEAGLSVLLGWRDWLLGTLAPDGRPPVTCL